MVVVTKENVEKIERIKVPLLRGTITGESNVGGSWQSL